MRHAILLLVPLTIACQTTFEDAREEGAEVGEAIVDPSRSVGEEFGEAIDTTREALDDRDHDGFASSVERAIAEAREEIALLGNKADDAGDELGSKADELERELQELRAESKDNWQERALKIQRALDELSEDINEAVKS